ncbi:hypothetical protein AN618_18570 [Fervidicola ferrireducens]|uniref:Uncharacterized protein n=1 Tax=Fervidicola ferrireducens TaxID=520764 RepID=A0A140L4L4_9FIRM|nr:hypothetical protein [Fervidicola ferrireducens]KXG75489.1 hypothetical protein AN618_18570 [Fervidicola ferrireducens]
MNEIFGHIKKLLFRIKDPAILMGTLYLCSFLLLWPFWTTYHGGPLDNYQLMLLSIVAVVLVHIFLNWTYVVIVAVPALAAAVLFGVGAAIWIFSPTYIGIISGILLPFTTLFGLDSSSSAIISGIGETVSRIGQFMMILAGGLWWLVEKAKDVRQPALVFYLMGLASFGFLSSITSAQALLAFLFFWLVVDAKLRNVEIPTIGMIFRVLTTIAIIFKIPFLPVRYNGVLGGLVWGYKMCLTGGLLAIVWKADQLVNLLPEKFKQYGVHIVSAAERVIKI